MVQDYLSFSVDFECFIYMFWDRFRVFWCCLHRDLNVINFETDDGSLMIRDVTQDDLHNVICNRHGCRLEESEVKRVARVVLEGLVTMHEEDFAHKGTIFKWNSTQVSSQVS